MLIAPALSPRPAREIESSASNCISTG